LFDACWPPTASPGGAPHTAPETTTTTSNRELPSKARARAPRAHDPRACGPRAHASRARGPPAPGTPADRDLSSSRVPAQPVITRPSPLLR
jgi:hypothetical protein